MATVSVVIPSFNYGRFLREAIASIRAQTFTDWECVVVDDGSTDGTEEIVRALAEEDPRIRYVWKENGGLPAARNTGLAATTGTFVQFLDADDYIGTDKLAHQLQLFELHPEADIVYGDVRYFADVDIELGRKERRSVSMPSLQAVPSPSDDILAALVRDNIMVVQAPLIRRSILKRVGGFDPTLRQLEDWDCWLRCAEAGAVFLRDRSSATDTLSYVRLHAGSLSDDRLKMLKTAIQIRGQLNDRLPTEDLRRLNALRTHEQWAQIGGLQALGEHPVAGFRRLLRASLAERRVKWLMWALLIPVLRLPPGRRAYERWRRRQSLRASAATMPTTIRSGD